MTEEVDTEYTEPELLREVTVPGILELDQRVRVWDDGTAEGVTNLPLGFGTLATGRVRVITEADEVSRLLELFGQQPLTRVYRLPDRLVAVIQDGNDQVVLRLPFDEDTEFSTWGRDGKEVS